jgi:hypothetical protein
VITDEIIHMAVQDHARIVRPVNERIEEAPDDPAGQLEALVAALAMLGFERGAVARLLLDYIEDHSEESAYGFTTGLQLGVPIARPERAEEGP